MRNIYIVEEAKCRHTRIPDWFSNKQKNWMLSSLYLFSHKRKTRYFFQGENSCTKRAKPRLMFFFFCQQVVKEQKCLQFRLMLGEANIVITLEPNSNKRKDPSFFFCFFGKLTNFVSSKQVRLANAKTTEAKKYWVHRIALTASHRRQTKNKFYSCIYIKINL